MKTYKITKHFTCPYIGQRNGGDKELRTGLTLKEAQKELLNMFNEQFETYAPNWGAAVLMTKNNVHQAYPTRDDGTRLFEWDARQFIIEEDILNEPQQ